MTNLAVRQEHSIAKPSGFRCRGGELDLIPTNKLLAIAQNFLELNEVRRPDQLISIELMFETMGVLFRWVDEHLKFKDWKYQLSSIIMWEQEYLKIEFEAQKKYSLLSLVMNQGLIQESELWGFAYHQGKESPYYYERKPMAEDFLVWLKKFFEETNENIIRWNEICRFAVPLLSEQLPIDELRDSFLIEVYNNAVEAAYSLGYEGDSDEEAFEHYVNEYDTLQGTELSMAWQEGFELRRFGPKQDWHTWIDIDYGEMYSRYSFYISREGCPFAWKMLEFDIDNYDIEFQVSMAEILFGETIGQIEDAMIQWNRTMSYGDVIEKDRGRYAPGDFFYEFDWDALPPERYDPKEKIIYRLATEGVRDDVDCVPGCYRQLRFDI